MLSNVIYEHNLDVPCTRMSCADVLEDCTDYNNVPFRHRSAKKLTEISSCNMQSFSACERGCHADENCNPSCEDRYAASEATSRDSDVSSTCRCAFDAAAGACDMDSDLVCTEPLSTADSAPCNPKPSTSGFVPNIANLQELTLSIRAALDRENDGPAEPGYLRRHGPEHSPQHFITSSMRNITAGWMVEVAMHFNLQPDTLFLAIDLFDRYLSKSQGFPRNMLQLLAVTCVLVAAKQEEVTPPTVEVLTEIAAHCFQAYDLVRLEHHLLDTLDWRVQPPTVYTFICLYTQALQVVPWEVFNLAQYFAELAAIDYESLLYPASMLATSALVISCAASNCHHLIEPLLRLSSYSQEEVVECYQHILDLHNTVFGAAASNAEQQAIQPFVTVNEKHVELGCNDIITNRIELC